MSQLVSSDNWELIDRLNRDMRAAAQDMNREAVKFMVHKYYDIQEYRKSGANRVRASSEEGEPHRLVAWVNDSFRRLEDDVRRAMDSFTGAYAVTKWMRSIVGIGPVIAAGFISELDIRKAEVAGGFWRHAGLDPTREWLGARKAGELLDQLLPGKKSLTMDDVVSVCNQMKVRWESAIKWMETHTPTREKFKAWLSIRPWQASLKRLCFILGESFVKFSNHENQYYGSIYKERKKYAIAKNMDGGYSDLARKYLSEKSYGKDTDALLWYGGYLPGIILQDWENLDAGRRKSLMDRMKGTAGSGTHMLPPSHIHMQSIRYTVKIFLSHLFEVMYRDYYNSEPPLPYALTLDGHQHYIPIPNHPFNGGGKSLKQLYGEETTKVD